MGPRQLAIHECKTLWRYIAKYGGHKGGAIKKLYEMGRLSQDYYKCGCPLCERYDSFRNYTGCTSCPWPGWKKRDVRCCTNIKSPYIAWERYPSKENAKKVYDLVKTFK